MGESGAKRASSRRSLAWRFRKISFSTGCSARVRATRARIVRPT